MQQAALTAGISLAIMIQTLRRAEDLTAEESAEANKNEISEKMPEWFDKSKIAIRFDACPKIDAEQSPMAEILQLSKELEDGKIRELTAPFKPQPIIDMLNSKGFKTWHNRGKSYFTK